MSTPTASRPAFPAPDPTALVAAHALMALRVLLDDDPLHPLLRQLRGLVADLLFLALRSPGVLASPCMRDDLRWALDAANDDRLRLAAEHLFAVVDAVTTN